jgi:hypothetical protein
MHIYLFYLICCMLYVYKTESSQGEAEGDFFSITKFSQRWFQLGVQESPINLVLLAAFTVVEAYTVGVLVTFFDQMVVIQAPRIFDSPPF